jgi:hypothetical protein
MVGGSHGPQGVPRERSGGHTGRVNVSDSSAARLEQLGDRSVWVCAAHGPMIATESDATDLVGKAYAHRADVVVIPVSRFPEGFFRLRTGIASALIQKFVNYRLQLVIEGDITAYATAGSALSDFVAESNRGAHVWFLSGRSDVEARLGGGRLPSAVPGA